MALQARAPHVLPQCVAKSCVSVAISAPYSEPDKVDGLLSADVLAGFAHLMVHLPWRTQIATQA